MQRRVNFLLYGEAFKYRKWSFKDHDFRKAKPLSIWTDGDIWSYLEGQDLPINPAYEKYDIDRTGCITCTGFDGWEEKMRKFSPALYRRAKKEKDQTTILEDFFRSLNLQGKLKSKNKKFKFLILYTYGLTRKAINFINVKLQRK